MKFKWELVCAIKEIDVEEVLQFDFEKKHLQFIIPPPNIYQSFPTKYFSRRNLIEAKVSQDFGNCTYMIWV
jgi:hypothetical protein